MELNEDQKMVRKELSDIYPQLLINARKTLGMGFDKHHGDLIAVCIEFYLEKPLEYQLKVISDGKLEHFLTHMMSFQAKLSTTRYWHHYRKFTEKIREFYPNYNYGPKYTDFPTPFEDEQSEVVSCMKAAIQDLNPYEKMIVNEYLIERNTYTFLVKKYKIDYTHLKKDAARLKKLIGNRCKHLR